MFSFRYFTSGPPPTEPAKLPRPHPKRENLNARVSDLNQQEGPAVLSPPRKSRRVMPQRDGFEENAHQVEKSDERVNDIRQATGERMGWEHAPMSIDFSVFGSRPPPRPTINR